MRGLKHITILVRIIYRVALLVSAWIETKYELIKQYDEIVALLVSAWIETNNPI